MYHTLVINHRDSRTATVYSWVQQSGTLFILIRPSTSSVNQIDYLDSLASLAMRWIVAIHQHNTLHCTSWSVLTSASRRRRCMQAGRGPKLGMESRKKTAGVWPLQPNLLPLINVIMCRSRESYEVQVSCQHATDHLFFWSMSRWPVAMEKFDGCDGCDWIFSFWNTRPFSSVSL